MVQRLLPSRRSRDGCTDRQARARSRRARRRRSCLLRELRIAGRGDPTELADCRRGDAAFADGTRRNRITVPVNSPGASPATSTAAGRPAPTPRSQAHRLGNLGCAAVAEAIERASPPGPHEVKVPRQNLFDEQSTRRVSPATSSRVLGPWRCRQAPFLWRGDRGIRVHRAVHPKSQTQVAS